MEKEGTIQKKERKKKDTQFEVRRPTLWHWSIKGSLQAVTSSLENEDTSLEIDQVDVCGSQRWMLVLSTGAHSSHIFRDIPVWKWPLLGWWRWWWHRPYIFPVCSLSLLPPTFPPSWLSLAPWPCKRAAPSGREQQPWRTQLLSSNLHPRVVSCTPTILPPAPFKVCFFSEAHTVWGEPCVASTSLIYSSLFYDFVLKTIGLGCNNTDVFASQENREFPLLSPQWQLHYLPWIVSSSALQKAGGKWCFSRNWPLPPGPPDQ